jgi:anti-sigma B factor antagonist
MVSFGLARRKRESTGDHHQPRWLDGTGNGGTKVVEQELRVTVESAPSGPTVRVWGEVDVQTSPVLDEQLQSVLDQGPSSVVVDLGEVTFLDSTGLSVLIAGLKRCQAAGGSLRVVAPQPNVRRVLEITGLTEAFDLAPEGPG